MWEIKSEILHGKKNPCVCLVPLYHQALNLSDNQGGNCPETRIHILHSEQMLTGGNLKEMILSPQLAVNNSLIHIHTFLALMSPPEGDLCPSQGEQGAHGDLLVPWGTE